MDLKQLILYRLHSRSIITPLATNQTTLNISHPKGTLDQNDLTIATFKRRDYQLPREVSQ